MNQASGTGATAAEPGSGGDYVIETRGLTRYFGRRKVVDMIDLRVPRGSVYAFLGRNGSGKTTTLRMLLGLLEPTRGTASVLGHDSLRMPSGVRARIGYMSESHSVYRWMKVKQCAAFQSRFYPRWNQRIFDAVIDHFRLSRSARAAGLSRGERAGLSLALTLAPEPELLVLDDPAIGLDPAARRSLLESMVYVTRRSDRTILFSSHLLSDVERVADYIGVLDRLSGRTRRKPLLPRRLYRPGTRRHVPGRKGGRMTTTNTTKVTKKSAWRAMAWKELRENTRWAVLALLLLSAGMAYGLRQVRLSQDIAYNSDGQSLTSNAFVPTTVFGCALAAILLGLMQTLPERRPDPWAFLVHRPVSRHRARGVAPRTAFHGRSLYRVLCPARRDGHSGDDRRPAGQRHRPHRQADREIQGHQHRGATEGAYRVCAGGFDLPRSEGRPLVRNDVSRQQPVLCKPARS
jgi:ABC-2 type transport system ATP-binding protein